MRKKNSQCHDRRREIYKIAGEQMSLFSNIGMAELNKILENRVLKIQNKMKDEIDAPSLQPKLEESDIKNFLKIHWLK
jgi:hypothetical protein